MCVLHKKGRIALPNLVALESSLPRHTARPAEKVVPYQEKKETCRKFVALSSGESNGRPLVHYYVDALRVT